MASSRNGFNSPTVSRYLSQLIDNLTIDDQRMLARILNNWDKSLKNFIKVIPNDYKRMIENIKNAENSGLSGDDALMAAFEANKSDLARVSGN